MTTPRAGAPFPTSHVAAALRVAPEDLHEALGLVAYAGHGAGRDDRPVAVRTPGDWFGQVITEADLTQPNGPLTPSTGRWPHA